MIDKIVCVNRLSNSQVEFNRTSLTPFMLKSVDGVSSYDNNVTVSDHTMTDGAEYLGSIQQKRNIVITGKMLGDLLSNKEKLYEVFNTGDIGDIYITDSDGEQRTAEYYTEKVDADGNGIPTKAFTVSLICPDPAFYGVDEEKYSMSNWVSLFEFEHRFKLEPFGKRSEKRNVVIDYKSGVPTGLKIVITASGDVVNPSVVNTLQNKRITIGDSQYPFKLSAGQSLTITTGDCDKHVLYNDGYTEKEINQYLTENSDFFQLVYGENPIGYTADSGIEAMTIDIYFRRKYRGA